MTYPLCNIPFDTETAMPAERTHKFKLDLRAQDARALLALIEAAGYQPTMRVHAAHLERVRARTLAGMRWLAEKYGVPFGEFLASSDTTEDADASA